MDVKTLRLKHYYYEQLFPNELYIPTTLDTYRVIGRFLHNNIMVRNVKIESRKLLLEQLKTGQINRIELGQISRNIKNNNKIYKELVFDIDIDDYDKEEKLRTCDCKPREICEDCYIFLVAGMKILSYILKFIFNYKCFIFYFSGRRGIHCFVYDHKALVLTNDQRKVIYQHIENYKIYNDNIIDSMFDDDNNNNKIKKFNGHIVKTIIQDILKPLISKHEKLNKIIDINNPSMVLKYFWPRLDKNVTIKRNHLIKCPFQIHPSTGFIGLPIYNFNIHQSVVHVSEIKKKEKLILQIIDYTKTKMNNYMDVFDYY